MKKPVREEGFMVCRVHPADGLRPAPVFYPTREGAEADAARLVPRNLPVVVIPVVRFTTAEMESGAAVPLPD